MHLRNDEYLLTNRTITNRIEEYTLKHNEILPLQEIPFHLFTVSRNKVHFQVFVQK